MSMFQVEMRVLAANKVNQSGGERLLHWLAHLVDSG